MDIKLKQNSPVVLFKDLKPGDVFRYPNVSDIGFTTFPDPYSIYIKSTYKSTKAINLYTGNILNDIYGNDLVFKIEGELVYNHISPVEDKYSIPFAKIKISDIFMHGNEILMRMIDDEETAYNVINLANGLLGYITEDQLVHILDGEFVEEE